MLRSVFSTIKIIMLTHFQNSDPNLHVVLAGLQLLHKMCNNCIPTGTGVLCFCLSFQITVLLSINGYIYSFACSKTKVGYNNTYVPFCNKLIIVTIFFSIFYVRHRTTYPSQNHVLSTLSPRTVLYDVCGVRSEWQTVRG